MPCERKALAKDVHEAEGLSIKRSCALVCLSRSMWYYQNQKDDTAVETKLLELSELKPHRGIDYFFHRLRNEGYSWNRKRILRVYRKLGLKLKRRRKKRLPKRILMSLEVPQRPLQVWSMDFMSDRLTTSRSIRFLNIIDDYSRMALCIESNYSMPAERVIESLERTIEMFGKPERIRVDNGPEFLSNRFTTYCEQQGIKVQYIQPGKPSQNAFIERFNRTFREDVLDAYLMENISEARALAHDFMFQYNNHHPHKSLNRETPRQRFENFSRQLTA